MGEKIPSLHGTFEIESQPKSRNELLRELPKGLQERVAKLGKWASREKVSQLLVDLCAFKPYSYEELALIIQRAAKPMKDKYIKPLRLANKLFYWIPEMINHPLQSMLLTLRWRGVILRRENNRIKIYEYFYARI